MSKFSDQEEQFKKRARRRLIGAIALVVLAVAILPFVLDDEPQPISENVSIQIPPQDTTPPVAKETPAPATPAGAPESAVSGKAAPPEPAAALSPPEPAEKKPAETPPTLANQDRPKPVEAPEKRAEVAEKPSAQNDEFVVQLGAFSNPKNAKQTQNKLKSAGIKTYTETVESGEGKTIRVRAGPYSSREQAEKIRDRLKAMGYSGLVAAK
ncbi:MAG: SPOR domain-containing protein [Burkholderiales bacterium]